MPVPQNRIHSWLAGWLGAGLLRLAHATWRVTLVDPRGVDKGVRDGSSPALVAFWHRHILTALSHSRGYRLCVPVSQSQDGEYVAQAMRRMRLRSVRGSTSRGSAAMLRALVGQVQQGWSAAITPDGPRGPKFHVQPGVVLLARRCGLPVHPVGVAVEKAWVLASWDEFVIPKPWTRIVIVAGPPLSPAGYHDAAGFCDALKSAIFEATDRAHAELAARP